MPRFRDGFTLVELTLVSALMAIIMLVSTLLLMYGMRSWRRISDSQDATFQLSRASRRLREELRQTSFNECKALPQPGSRGKLGDVLNFLSALDAASGQVCFQAEGIPFWQRNVVYYLALETGDSCPSRRDGQGYEVGCPHKVLWRRVLDTDRHTSPDTNPKLTVEDLLDDPLAALADPGALSTEAVAHHLLDFRARLAPQPGEFPDEVLIELRANNGDQVLQQQISVFPRNVQ